MHRQIIILEKNYINKSIIDRKIKNGYTKSSVSQKEQTLLKSVFRKIDSLGDTIHTSTGISKSIQAKAGVVGGVLIGAAVINKLMSNQPDEEEQKLQLLNQRVNGNDGQYTKY